MFRQSLAVAWDHRRVLGAAGDSKGSGQMLLVAGFTARAQGSTLPCGKGRGQGKAPSACQINLRLFT